MEKISVKKPFTVLVAVIVILALGIVSMLKMTMDLLPEMSLPYLMVITPYPGASPEKVEKAMQAADNVVLMKVYKNFEEMADLLAKNDMAEQAVLVSRAGLDDEKIIYNVVAHKKDKLNYLSTILTRKN